MAVASGHIIEDERERAQKRVSELVDVFLATRAKPRNVQGHIKQLLRNTQDKTEPEKVEAQDQLLMFWLFQDPWWTGAMPPPEVFADLART